MTSMRVGQRERPPSHPSLLVSRPPSLTAHQHQQLHGADASHVAAKCSRLSYYHPPPKNISSLLSAPRLLNQSFNQSIANHQSINQSINQSAGADPEPPLPGGGGGHKWPMKPKASLRREAPKGGGWGRGSPPPAGGGPGGLPRKFFEKLHQNCAFWGNQYTFFALKIYMKKCVSLNLHIDYSYFFFKILRNLHQNGAFWAHIN